MEDYNITYNTQSLDSSESMPLGGHDAGCNVWVKDNELCIYMSQSGTFDENGTMLKLGRMRLWLEEKEKLSVNFKQELELEKGQIQITAGEQDNEMCIRDRSLILKIPRPLFSLVMVSRSLGCSSR